jgi:hypothetical protein
VSNASIQKKKKDKGNMAAEMDKFKSEKKMLFSFA